MLPAHHGFWLWLNGNIFLGPQLSQWNNAMTTRLDATFVILITNMTQRRRKRFESAEAISR